MKIIINGTHVSDGTSGVSLDRALSRLGRMDTGVIPDGVRFISGQQFIFELGPGVRNVDMKWKDYISLQRRIAFPYLVFYFQQDKHGQAPVFIFSRNKPLRSLDDELYAPALPNCLYCGRDFYYACGALCGCDLHSSAHKLRAQFFEQQFNRDGYAASGHYEYLCSLAITKRRFCKIRNPEAWERASLKDPKFILKMDWIKTKHTPRSLLANHMHNPSHIMGRMIDVILHNR